MPNPQLIPTGKGVRGGRPSDGNFNQANVGGRKNIRIEGEIY
jgi:hypothetical protein